MVEGGRESEPIIVNGDGGFGGGGIPFSFLSNTSGLVGGGQLSGGGLLDIPPLDFDLSDFSNNDDTFGPPDDSNDPELSDDDFRVTPDEFDTSTPPENFPPNVSDNGFNNRAPDPTSSPDFTSLNVLDIGDFNVDAGIQGFPPSGINIGVSIPVPN